MKKLLIAVFPTCAIFLCAYVEALPVLALDSNDISYDDCGGKDSNQIASVTVTNCCEKDEICSIKKGDTTTLNIKWKTFQPTVPKIQSTLYLQLSNPAPFTIPMDVTPNDACEYLKCPLTKDTEINYSANFTVPSYMLTGSGRIWWYGYEETKDDPLLCLNFQVQVEK